MLEKKHRLKKRKEFGYIFKKGRSFSNKTLILNYIPTKLKDYKVGFSVSKKIGNAVVRNKVKRRLREAFRELHHGVDKKYNYVFVARKGIEEMTYLEVIKSMKYCLEKTRLIKGENND
jgi:ribonuclease P protein component